jgi:hypothetical protein
MAGTAAIVVVIAQGLAQLGTLACPTEQGAVEVKEVIDYYKTHTFAHEAEIVPSGNGEKRALHLALGTGVNHGCGFLGVGSSGTEIARRDGYVLAHWPSLGADFGFRFVLSPTNEESVLTFRYY